jgi:hypothetical protein
VERNPPGIRVSPSEGFLISLRQESQKCGREMESALSKENTIFA